MSKYNQRKDGYFQNSKGELQHRNMLRPILSILEEVFPEDKWVVHHLDGDKSNNDIENLDIMSYAKHASMHMKGHKFSIGNQNRKGKTLKYPYAYYVVKNSDPYKRVWQCTIKYNGRNKSLGYFNDFLSCEIVAKLVIEGEKYAELG